ncbi:protein GFS12 isoform X2 [Iris pallida]|uniref:Protein GFS12 isoform X2 n=1 Tax=Iris pallida TaxID=29817 RepID=A0AAX6DGL2_IRIPA|nr:protein GFS12 isoform X2 [Iris pallida]
MEGGALPSCFECLKRRIETDIPADIVFRYGISDSALPFGSSAVVQIYQNGGANSTEKEDVSAQFVLVRLNNENNSSCSNHYLENGVAKNTCREFSSLDKEMGLDSSITSSFQRISCLRIIAALAPDDRLLRGSYATIEDLLSKYFSESIEDNVMSSLNLFAKGEVAGEPCASFLSLAGFPSFSGSNFSSRVRHPNISPCLGIIGTPGHNYLLQLKAPYTLENILHYSPNALKSDWHIRFLVYQILSALVYMHGLGIAHGNICPSSIRLTDSCWAWLSISNMRLLRGDINLKEGASSSLRVGCCMDCNTCLCIYADRNLSDSLDWHSHFKQWWMGELSNYEYLLVLNRLAGRRWGDHTFHPVMPWVIDFSVKPDENSDTGWRDLKKSKWRLAKGDEQLDFTFQTSEVPHHISDEVLSELAVCSYKARRLPLRILRSAVRSVYEPNEYPANMQRLYQWTPDECIPEFYSDPHLFVSLHAEMSDLAVPAWASTPEEFVSLHRDALESERVSRQIHHWIDITFGYKLSGEASISAKNVTLPISDPSTPKSMGRRQLFTRPHPTRRGIRRRTHWNRHREDCVSFQDQETKNKLNSSVSSDISSQLLLHSKENLLPDTSFMEDLEEAISFCEHASYLNPIYSDQEHVDNPNFQQNDHNLVPSELNISASPVTSDLNLCHFLESFEADDSGSVAFQELLHWRHKLFTWETCLKDLTGDIFSIGCILAELYLKRPLFDPVSFGAYKESGVLPGIVQELPPHVAVLVEACIHKDWERRPSAQYILESQYFPPTVRSAYLFLAPLQILAKTGSRLQYAANFASEGALKAMGAYAAEMCTPYCLPFIMSPLSDVETESALCLLKEFLKYLNPHAVKALLLPVIQKILQAGYEKPASDYSHLKVSLLQDSFVRDIWTRVGKQAYLEKVHPLVISNLFNSPNKASASAASVVLIGSSEELGIPITVQQTVLPIIHSFGKGVCADGIDALVRIGALLGEKFVVRQILPLLRNAILSCIDASHMNKPEPLHSWISLALIDSFSTLAGLVSVLPVDVVLKELIQDHICLHVKVLMQSHMDLPVLDRLLRPHSFPFVSGLDQILQFHM